MSALSLLPLAADGLVSFVGLLHVYIFRLESLSWYRGSARGFGVTAANYDATAGFAANQGFYNLVLAAGLLHAVWTGDWNNKVWFSAAVLCCGIIGFITTGSAKILQAQCLPSTLALVALFAADAAKGTLATSALGGVGAAAAVTVALSLFVKARLTSDAAFHAKKRGGQ